jgi:hypothetical protein
MMTKRALVSAIATFVCLSTAPARGLVGRTPRAPRPAWGTVATNYYTMGVAEFSPQNSATTYANSVGPSLRWGTVGSARFLGTPHLPPGSRLTYVELDSCDSSGSMGGGVVLHLENCDYLGNCNDAPPLAYLTSADNLSQCDYAWADLTGQGYTVNNTSDRLQIDIYTFDGANSAFAGVVLGYKLQVSPAPAQPTFLDVPVSDPGFPFIEALAASGITAGCGGGNFCPDAPVTRRQMAVFLAKALGLSWAGF